MQLGIDSFHSTAPNDLGKHVVLKAKIESFSNPTTEQDQLNMAARFARALLMPPVVL
jgi:hypothetical protein